MSLGNVSSLSSANPVFPFGNPDASTDPDTPGLSDATQDSLYQGISAKLSQSLGASGDNTDDGDIIQNSFVPPAGSDSTRTPPRRKRFSRRRHR